MQAKVKYLIKVIFFKRKSAYFQLHFFSFLLAGKMNISGTVVLDLEIKTIYSEWQGQPMCHGLLSSVQLNERKFVHDF